MPKKIAIISNPVAGKGRAHLLSSSLQSRLQMLGSEVTVHSTSPDLDGEDLTQRVVEDGIDVVVACGGDGTVHEVINGMKPDDSHTGEPYLAVLPAGRCNNFWKALKLPGDTESIADALIRFTHAKVDLGKVGCRYFATVAALGLDSAVSEYVDSGGPPKFLRGTLSYLYGLMFTLPGFHYPEVSLTGDFGSIQGQVLLVAVANTDSYGGSFMIAPGATPVDGLIDVCVIRSISKYQVLRVLPKVFSGKHVMHPAVSMHTTKRLSVDSDEPLLIWADGERINRTPVDITVHASAIRVITTV